MVPNIWKYLGNKLFDTSGHVTSAQHDIIMAGLGMALYVFETSSTYFTYVQKFMLPAQNEQFNHLKCRYQIQLKRLSQLNTRVHINSNAKFRCISCIREMIQGTSKYTNPNPFGKVNLKFLI